MACCPPETAESSPPAETPRPAPRPRSLAGLSQFWYRKSAAQKSPPPPMENQRKANKLSTFCLWRASMFMTDIKYHY